MNYFLDILNFFLHIKFILKRVLIENVMKYLFEETQDIIGSVMVVDVEPLGLAEKIISGMDEKRVKIY